MKNLYQYLSEKPSLELVQIDKRSAGTSKETVREVLAERGLNERGVYIGFGREHSNLEGQNNDQQR